MPSEAVAAEGDSSPILGFIIGFLKLFGYLLLFILAVFLGGFIYFKVFNKDENIGFQDFLIDKLFHRKQEDFNADIISSFTPEPNKPIIDPLQTLSTPPQTREEPESFTSSELISESEAISEREPSPESASISEGEPGETKDLLSSESTNANEPSPELESGIPDWLKQTTSLAGMEEEAVTETKEPEVIPEDMIPEPEPISEPEIIPEMTEATPATEPVEIPTFETPAETTSDDLGELPAWMSGMNQDAFQEELQETLSPTPVETEEEPVEPKDLSSPEPTTELPPPDDSIPDWLRASTLSTPEVTEEIQEEKIETGKKKTPAKHTEKTPNEKKESHSK